jgi:hypothetical protein
VDPDYFEALGQPILIGRPFDHSDVGSDSAVVIVNTAFVEQAFGGRSPLGRRVRFVSGTEHAEARWFEIVGVVGPLGANILEPDGGEAVYLPGTPGEIRPLRLAIHVGSSPEEFTPRLREIVTDVDPMVTIDDYRAPRALSWFRPIDWYLDLLRQAGLAALLAVLLSLAVSSLYAVTSFAVAERTREIGIRRALGAGRDSIARTVGKRAIRQIGLGAMLATPVVVWLFVQLQEYARIRLSGPALLVTALLPGLAVLIVVAVLACAIPTVRALRIDPNEVLKTEG